MGTPLKKVQPGHRLNICWQNTEADKLSRKAVEKAARGRCRLAPRGPQEAAHQDVQVEVTPSAD
jgi:hypothetical protein